MVWRAPVLVFMGLVFAGLAHPAEAASPFCAIDITVTPTEREAPVTSTQPAAVTFNGEYTVDFPSFERAQVTLTAVIDQGWATTVSPASITVTNARTGPFSVTTVVPAGTFPSQIGVLTVTARMIVGGIQCTDQETGLLIKPRPYFDGLTVRMDPSRLELARGTESFKLTVAGNASVPVSLSFTMEGPDGLSMRGPSTLVLPPPGTGPSNVTATIQLSGPNLAPGTYDITVTVRGTTQEGLSQNATLRAPLTVPEGVGVALSSPVVLVGAAGAAAAGAFVFFWWRRKA